MVISRSKLTSEGYGKPTHQLPIMAQGCKLHPVKVVTVYVPPELIRMLKPSLVNFQNQDKYATSQSKPVGTLMWAWN